MSGDIVPTSHTRYERLESSQHSYVAELREQVEALPGDFPPYSSLSKEQEEFLAKYCSGDHANASLRNQYPDIVPLYRNDIVDPHFAGNVSELTAQSEGVTNTSYHWYTAPTTEYTYRGPYEYIDPQKLRMSRIADKQHVRYMRQRRSFHVAFMETILNDADPAQVNTVLADTERLKLPRMTHPVTHVPAPDFMYNKTNWATASLLSALMLPPEKCSADMKRRAIELFATLADKEAMEQPHYAVGRNRQEHPLSGFSGTEKKAQEQGLLRLPWSLRLSDDELRMPSHGNQMWRQNQVVMSYLGPVHSPKADGLTRFLHDHPLDYIQLLILLTYDSHSPGHQVRDFAAVAKLAPEIKDVIFSKDASFNTLFDDRQHSLPDHQLGLSELLTRSGNALSDQARDQISNQQAMRIQSLTGELLRANTLIEDLRNQTPQVRTVYVERQYTSEEQLFMRHGMNPTVSNEGCAVFVTALRTLYDQKHGPSSSDPNPEGLAQAHRELDKILLLRGLPVERREIGN